MGFDLPKSERYDFTPMSSQSIHQFAEKVALISDVSHPLGHAAAMQLALLGAFVIVGEPSDQSSGIVREMISLGTLADSVSFDRNEIGRGQTLVQAAAKKFGRLDLLVNCRKLAGDMPEVFAETEDINRAASQLMRERPKPKIVNCFSTYCIKSAERTAFESAAKDLTNKTVTVLAPKFRSNTIIAHEDRAIPVNTGGLELRPRSSIAWDDAARVAVFLLSSESISLNGQCLVIQ